MPGAHQALVAQAFQPAVSQVFLPATAQIAMPASCTRGCITTLMRPCPELPQAGIHLDRFLNLQSSFCMRAGIVILMLSISAVAAFAQQAPAPSSVIHTNSGNSSYSPSRLRLSNPEEASAQTDVIRGKHFQVSGPLVHVAKSKSIWDAPRRLFHLINPFAKREPQPRIERLEHLSPNAWTTTVGWHPARTGLDDPTRNCDGGIGLVTVSRTDR